MKIKIKSINKRINNALIYGRQVFDLPIGSYIEVKDSPNHQYIGRVWKYIHPKEENDTCFDFFKGTREHNNQRYGPYIDRYVFKLLTEEEIKFYIENVQTKTK